MGFRGDLRNVQLADILQTLAQNQQEGVLTLSNGSSTRRLHFTNAGVALLDPQVAGRRRLGEILLRSHMITQEHLDEALREQSRRRRFLGEILIEQGVIEEPDLQHILQVQVEEELYELFRIMDGTFEFEEGEPDELPLHHVVPFHVDSVVLEAARRLDEWSVIGRSVPSLSRVFVPVEGAEAPYDADPTQAEEDTTVLSQLDGTRTVQATADALLASPFVVAKVLSRLCEQGRVREASQEEVMAAATACLNSGNRVQAVQLLESLDPDRITDPRVLSDLSHLFREAEQGARAAQLRARLAEWARQQGDLDEAWRQLREAKKDQPSSVDILLALIELAQQQHELEIEVRLLKELATALSGKGDADGAVQALERVHQLMPTDADARRQLVETCLRARQKSRAVELLEEEAEELRAAERLPELATLYKRILAIDGRRNDVRKALSKIRRSAAERAIRRIGGLVVLVIALVATAVWVLQRVRRDQAESDLANAHAVHEAGDLVQARSLLQSILDRYTIDSVTFSAAAELRTVDDKLRERNLEARMQLEQSFETRLVEIEGLVDQRQYADALGRLLALVPETKEPFLEDRVQLRLRSTCQAFLENVADAAEVVDTFRAPQDDASAASALAKLRGLYPANTGEQVAALRALVEASSKKAESGPWVDKVRQATETWSSTYLRLGPKLDELSRRVENSEKMGRISADYERAGEAVEAGDLLGAITFYRKVLDTYGEGELRESIEVRLRRLENAQRIAVEIADYLANGRDADAAELARLSRDEYERLELLSILHIPVRIDSHPAGATVERDGEVLGDTPLLLPVGAETSQVVALRCPGFESMRVTIDSREALEQSVWLKKRTRTHVSLNSRSESRAVSFGGMLFVATRDGALHAVDPQDPTRQFSVPATSLIGSRTEPVVTSQGVLHTLSDGRLALYEIRARGLEPRWQKDLKFELRYTPQVLGNLALVSGPRQIVAIELDTGKIAFQAPLDDYHIAAEPKLVQTVLVVPLVGGGLLGWDVVSRTTVFHEATAQDVVGPMAAAGSKLALVTADGQLSVFDVATRQTVLRVEEKDLPVAPPAWVEDRVWLCYAKRIVRIDPLDGRSRSVDFAPKPSTTVTPLTRGTLLLGAADGQLYGLSTDSMQPLFRTYAGDRPIAGAPLAADEFLVVLCEDGALRVFDR